MQSKTPKIGLAFSLLLAGCATTRTPALVHDSAPRCPQGAASLQSPPGIAWWADNRWRFANDADAGSAYERLVSEASPWPDWYSPYEAELKVGTRFQMAISPGQSPDQPGAFGTFDNIASVQDVRDRLAVKQAWKPDVDRVVIYEVVRALPVRIGPIGPQVDGDLCRILPGRYSQFQALAARGTLRSYLQIVEIRPIR